MYGFNIIVEGDYALFTRNSLKVERVSYEVPTPGAIEGMLKSIYWKPPIKYIIKKIVVFNPIKFENIRRNEMKNKLLLSSVKKQMNGGSTAELYASEDRTQRGTMLLKNVKYGISFEFQLTGLKCDHEDESEEKHYNIILRRLKKGQHFRQPCLGCREFPTKKIELVDDFDLSQVSPELKGDFDLGYMLYHMKFRDGGIPVNNDWDNPVFSDKADAVYYHPHMIDGVIDVEKYYRDVMKC
ncbi:MAG: type I-C CRISPR-associated protein Cas5c [Oscillospiraceae bacterium]